jgi:hypothetical protein
MWSQATKFKPRAIALACAAVLAGCGGGGGGSSDGSKFQAIDFNYPGGTTVAAPPAVATSKLVATATGGGAVTFTSNTPDTCTVSGDTLSLLKAGECSVTASQAGGSGYAPATARQLFVIPKIPQRLVFRNPGTLPLDSTPLQLVATSSAPGKTVAFESSTPGVCTVSGTTLTKVGNGICTVTASQAGDDIYGDVKAVKNIPIGTATSPALTFLSGYVDASHTKEGGGAGQNGLTSENGWWCNGLCTTTVPADGNSLTFDFTFTLPTAPDGRWIGWDFEAWAYPAGITDLAKGADTTAGVHIDAQAAMKFNLGENPEWFGSSDNKVKVQLVLGHHAMVPDSDATKPAKDCNVTLQSVLTPTSAAPTDYSLGLKDKFTISEACGLTGLDVWNELQDYPISKIVFAADSMNFSAPMAGTTTTFRNRITLTGPITFQ